MTWTRPQNIPFPAVWWRFEGRKPLADGRMQKFKVQDVSEDMKSEVLAKMVEIFSNDEPTCRSSKISSCPKSMHIMTKIWEKCFVNNIALVCVLDEDLKPGQKPTIVGINMTTIARRSDEREEYEVEAKAWRDVMGAMNIVIDMADVFNKYEVEEYMTAFGLLVLPEYRGQNIGAEILKARIPLCKAIGISLTATVFSAIASQRLADKVGFKTVAEISYRELDEKHGFKFPNITEESSKLMALKIT